MPTSVLCRTLVVLALTSVAAPAAAAQRLADIHPTGVDLHRISPEPWQPLRSIVVEPERRALWPWFVLGGAVVGAGTVVVMAASSCDAGCQDDGGWGRVPAYVAAGALVGAVVGGVLGVVVDLSRRTERATASTRQ